MPESASVPRQPVRLLVIADTTPKLGMGIPGGARPDNVINRCEQATSDEEDAPRFSTTADCSKERDTRLG